MKYNNQNALVTNPAGVYRIKITYQKVKCNIMIKSIDDYEFDIYVKTNKKITNNQLEGLKQYLETEGYFNEARKHNLYW